MKYTVTINGREFHVEVKANHSYIPTVIPKGTKAEDWMHYDGEMAVHEFNIGRERFYLDRFVALLKYRDPERIAWTPDQIMRVLKEEIDRSASMDAPNKPGYYRANND